MLGGSEARLEQIWRGPSEVGGKQTCHEDGRPLEKGRGRAGRRWTMTWDREPRFLHLQVGRCCGCFRDDGKQPAVREGWWHRREGPSAEGPGGARGLGGQSLGRGKQFLLLLPLCVGKSALATASDHHVASVGCTGATPPTASTPCSSVSALCLLSALLLISEAN